MKVSALIPTYNRRAYVQRAVESVLAQTVPVDEIVIIDDGSTDGTAELIQARYGNRVRLICQSNSGVSGARRAAVREARNEWVAFLDSDDEWTSDRNRVLTEAANRIPSDVAWIFGDVSIVQDQGDNQTIYQRFGLHLDQSPKVFEDSLTVQHPFQFGLLQGSLIRRDALIQVDAFGAGLHHSEDYLTGVQVASRFRYAAVNAVVTLLYRTSDLKMSSLDLTGRNSPDYYRARMMAFSLIIQTGRSGKWGECYADAVQGLCKVYAEAGAPFLAISLEQFRYGITMKSLVFECAALLGRPGLEVWKKFGRGFRRIRGQEVTSHHSIGEIP